jgi:tRNA wybutosine-synthesizing protein 1
MSNFINSLLYGFTNILSVGPEQPREGEEEKGSCSGSNGEGCCQQQDQPKKKEAGGCCQTSQGGSNDACCSSPAAVVKEPAQKDSCCQSDTGKSCACEGTANEPVVIENMKIIFSTLTGTAKTMATEIQNKIEANSRVTVNKIDIMDVTEYDNDNLLQETAVCVFILSTYNVEGPLDW